MGLKLRQSADQAPVSGKFVNTKALRDYPLVLVRTKRFGTRPGYRNKGTDDYVVGDFIALDKDDKVVLSVADGLWSIKRSQNGGPGVMFRQFDTNSPGDVHVITIDLVGVKTKDGSTTDMNIPSDVTPSAKQLKVLESALADLDAESPLQQETTSGWGNSADYDDEPPY